MQVNLLSLATADASAATAAAALLPGLAKLTRPSPETEALRAQKEKDEKRRDDETRALAADTLTTRGTTQTILRAERELHPSSGAWQRQQARLEGRQEMVRQRAAFQQALNDASTRDNTANRPDAMQPAPEGAPKSDGAGVRNGGANTTTGERRFPTGIPARPPSSPPTSDSTRPAPPAAARAADQPVATIRVASAAGPSGAPAAPATGSRVVSGGDAARLPATAAPPARGVASAPAARTAGLDAKPAAVPVSGPEAARFGVRGVRASFAAGRPAEPAETGNRDANIERILRVVRGQIGKERSVATLRLDPPELGRLRLHMDLRKDVLFMRVDTQIEAARRLLSDDVEKLRHGLESVGIRLERIEIRPPAATPEHNESGLPQEAEGRQPGAEETWEREPQAQSTDEDGAPGTESLPVEPVESGLTGLSLAPAAESLVDILA